MSFSRNISPSILANVPAGSSVGAGIYSLPRTIRAGIEAIDALIARVFAGGAV
jgi:hypothetical protein